MHIPFDLPDSILPHENNAPKPCELLQGANELLLPLLHHRLLGVTSIPEKPKGLLNICVKNGYCLMMGGRGSEYTCV